jgi:hypothetical protein
LANAGGGGPVNLVSLGRIYMPTSQAIALGFSLALISVASVHAADSPEDLVHLLQSSDLTQADLGAIMEISTTMETCASIRPDFERATASHYANWKQTNQLGLRVLQPSLDAMKRAMKSG